MANVKLQTAATRKFKTDISTLQKQHVTFEIYVLFPQAPGLDLVVAGPEVDKSRSIGIHVFKEKSL